jgi:hypothetical protein
MLLPQNAQLPRNMLLPQNAQLPRNTLLPRNMLLPQNAQLPRNTLLPRNMLLPQNAQLPRNTLLQHNTLLPQNAQLPRNTLLQHNTQPQPNAQLPHNALLPHNTQLPRNTLPHNNMPHLHPRPSQSPKRRRSKIATAEPGSPYAKTHGSPWVFVHFVAEEAVRVQRAGPCGRLSMVALKTERAARQQGSSFLRENSSNGGKTIRTFWLHSRRGGRECQG